MSDPILRGLDQILALADNGAYYPAMMADLQKLLQELRDFSTAYGGVKAKGSLKLTLDMTIDRFGQIDLTLEHATKHPRAPKAKGVAWATDDGDLTPANPHQMRMDLRDVSPPRAYREAD